MNRFASIVLLIAVAACGQTAPPGSAGDPALEANFVLPGTFSQATTLEDLRARFGAANVTIVEPQGSDPVRRVVLFADDPSRRAWVHFHDSLALVGVQGISVSDRGSHWRGKHGVRIGMSFAELRRINGKPFGFTGFDGEGRGAARDQWSLALDDDDATPGALDVAEGEHMYFNVDLGRRDGVQDLPVDALPRDESVSSDDPRFPRLGELVEVIAIHASTSLDDEWE